MSVKLLVAHHKPSLILESPICLPVHVGRALAVEPTAAWLRQRMPGDDTGDNVSALNGTLCELTAMYWAWKNFQKLGSPEWIGLMHYRRHFLLGREAGEAVRERLRVVYETLTPGYLADAALTTEAAARILDGVDIVVANPARLDLTVAEQFRLDAVRPEHRCRPEVLDMAVAALARRHPGHAAAAWRYLEGREHYWGNMFVMGRELFFRYAEWLFGILFETGERLYPDGMAGARDRALGYVGERLLGVFAQVLREEGRVVRTLPTSFLQDMDKPERLTPAFPGNGPALAAFVDDNQAPYFAVRLAEMATESGGRDVVIVSDGLTPERQNGLVTAGGKTLKLHFVKPAARLRQDPRSDSRRVGMAAARAARRGLLGSLLPEFPGAVILEADSPTPRQPGDQPWNRPATVFPASFWLRADDGPFAEELRALHPAPAPGPFDRFAGVNTGRDVVLVATGPSLGRYRPVPDALHLGVNRAFLREDISLDFLFVQELGRNKVPLEALARYGGAIRGRFFGIEANAAPAARATVAALAERCSAVLYDYVWEGAWRMPRFAVRPGDRPLECCGSVALAALQFALFTRPARLFLVGCDLGNDFHFGGDQLLPESHPREWIEFRDFARCHYPETRIVSINPARLAGLFEDTTV